MATRTRTHKTTTEVPVKEAGTNGHKADEALSREALRDAILNADDVQYEDVHVPEWGLTVTLRSLSGDARDRFEMEAQARNGKDPAENMVGLRSRLAARTIVDGEGKLVFTEADVKKLGERNAWALTRVAMVAGKLSALDESDIAELAGLLKRDPSASSGTD